MKQSPRASSPDGELHLKVPFWSGVIGFVVMIVLVALVATHLSDAKKFAALLQQAQPLWLIVAFVLQLGTYVSAGGLWRTVAKSAGYSLPLGGLARISVEMLSFNQLIPMVGMAGNFVLVRATRRMGLPYSLAMEALLVEILSQFIAFAVLGGLTVILLILRHDILPVILWLVAVFSAMMIAVSVGMIWLLGHRTWKPLYTLRKWKFAAQILDIAKHVSPERVLSPFLLLRTSPFYMAIFLLDSATLWTMMQAIDTPITPATALMAHMIASMAATLSFLPAGLGSYEAASTTMLTLLGAPVEAALTGTLLLRGFTFWLPIVPGLVLARRELR